MTNFTTRPLTSQKPSPTRFLESFLLWFVALPLFAVCVLYYPYRAVAWVQRELGVLPARAEELSFHPQLPDVRFRLPVAATPPVVAKRLDLDKLAKAVARHETASCTKGAGKTHNNCFGIMQWNKKGQRSFKRYAAREDSFKDFKRIWAAYYGRFPDLKLAKKFSGNDRPQQWLSNVTTFYNAL